VAAWKASNEPRRRGKQWRLQVLVLQAVDLAMARARPPAATANTNSGPNRCRDPVHRLLIDEPGGCGSWRHPHSLSQDQAGTISFCLALSQWRCSAIACLNASLK
jgi:hypothetical protein